MRICFFTCALLLALCAPAHSSPLMVDAVRDPQPLLPYCTWLADPEGRLRIEDVASGAARERFAPLPNGFPLKNSGPVWLRLIIGKTGPGPVGNLPSMEGKLVVDPGELPPGKSRLYTSAPPGPMDARGVWHTEEISARENFTLPEPGLTPMTVFIHLEETPGLWFSPTVSAQGALRPELLPWELVLPGLVLLALIGCLLRAVSDLAPWALWSGLFQLCVLLQVILPLPGLRAGFAIADLPALLAPGIALILLPHIGRSIFHSGARFLLQDGIFYFCSLLGVALALVPLLPGMNWLVRLFPLWPLLLAPLIPLCLGALAMKKPGSLAFTGAVVMPVLGSGVAFAALRYPELHSLAAQGAFWGLAVGGLGLVLAHVPKGGVSAAPKKDSLAQADFTLPAPAPSGSDRPGLSFPPSPETAPFTVAERASLPERDWRKGAAPAAPDLFPADSEFSPGASPARSGMDGEEYAGLGGNDPPLQYQRLTVFQDFPSSARNGPDGAPLPDADPALPDAPAYAAFSEQGDGSRADDSPDFPYAAGESPDSAPSAPAYSLPDADGANVIMLDEEDFSSFPMALMEALQGDPVRRTELSPAGSFLFNLHSLVREVHDIVSPLAKSKGLIFSWYISPSLPALLEGDAPRLRGALSLLLQNAVQATSQGAVELLVRKNPASIEPGDLLFTIADNGSAQRTDAGFFHAWELAAQSGGVFNVDYSPSGGTQVGFTVRFSLPADRHEEERAFFPAAEGGYAAEDADFSGAFDNDEEPIPVLDSVSVPAGDEPMDRRSADGAWPYGEPKPTSLPPEQPFLPDEGDRPCIVAAEMTISNRRLLANYLAGLSYDHLNAAHNADVPEILRARPVSLVIFDADSPESDILRTIAILRGEERERHLPPVPVLVLTGNPSQSGRMLDAGSTATLEKPFHKEALLHVAFMTVPGFASQESAAFAREANVRPQMPPEDAGAARVLSSAEHADGATAIPGMDAWDTVSLLPQGDGQAAGEERAREVDILAEALRDAPEQKGDSVLVSLPPRDIGSPGKQPGPPDEKGQARDDDAGGDTSFPAGAADDRAEPFSSPGSAAPMILGLSTEDVTPAAGSPASGKEAGPQSGAALERPTDGTDAGLAPRSGPRSKKVGRATISMNKQEAPPGNRARPPIVLASSQNPSAPSGQTSLTASGRTDPVSSTAEKNAPEKNPSSFSSPANAAPAQDGEASSGQVAQASTGQGGKASSGQVAAGPDATRPEESPHPSSGYAAGSLLDFFLPDAPGQEEENTESGQGGGGKDAETEAGGTVRSLSAVGTEGRGRPGPASGDGGKERPGPIVRGVPGDRPGPVVRGVPGDRPGPVVRSEAENKTERGVRSVVRKSPGAQDQGNGSGGENLGAEAVPDTRRESAPADAPAEPGPSGAELPADQSPPVSPGAELPAGQSPPGFHPLPGIEGEYMDVTALPLVPGLVYAVTDCLDDIRQGTRDGQSLFIQEAANRLAGKAEIFGLVRLGKLARCVERAAEAGDMNAVNTLVNDLEPVVSRYTEAMRGCFQSFMDSAR